MMVFEVKLDEGAKMPTKAHERDAGFDIYAPYNVKVKAHDSALIDTGVHISIPKGYVGFIKSKSGLNVKHGLLAEGVIDSDYIGSIMVKMYNHSDEDHYFLEGTKVTQIVFLPIPEVELEEVDDLISISRGTNGFGSSGV